MSSHPKFVSQRNPIPVRSASVAAAVAVLLTVAVHGATQRGRDHLYAISVDYLWSKRTGYYAFDAIEARYDTTRGDGRLWGATLAKRYVVGGATRLQVGAVVHGGFALNGQMRFSPLSENQFEERPSLLHVGFEPELQFVFGRTEGPAPYLLLGGALNYVRFRERFFFSESPSEQATITGYSAVLAARVCPSIHGGFGVDLGRRRNRNVGLVYAFRYWNPVRYGDKREMPLDPVEYWERFLTHTFRLVVSFTIHEE